MQLCFLLIWASIVGEIINKKRNKKENDSLFISLVINELIFIGRVNLFFYYNIIYFNVKLT